MITTRLCALLLSATLALPGASLASGSSDSGASAVVQVAQVSREAVRQAVLAEAERIREAKPSRIWCVPFARAVSGINIRGDAATWWKGAGKTYPKGQVPVSGAVLTFRSTGGMPRGHVAVVSEVLSPRQIRVDQANWVTNRITVDTVVIDISEANDWSAVRVGNQSNSFGKVYPTYGFIYKPHENS
ncbi:CHAP domain-containing protein [Cereibacter changlensis]|nr:CHAP domain-containing protein [Cereibacter changlensis]